MSSAYDQRILAQHFLKAPCLVASLLERSSIGPDDVVYEIGPGKGVITAQLALRCRQVVAVEKDPRLAALLRQQFASSSNVTIVEGDFLRYRLPRKPYKVFSNIPFNITKAIVTRLTTADCAPEDAYLAMQREAAEMFLGQPRESLSTVLLKPWFAVEIVHHFRRGDFVPAPRVDVVLLRLRKRGPPLVSRADRQSFRDFVVYGFTTWRPTLGAILKGIFTVQQLRHLSRELDLDMNVTPTALSFGQWLKLFASFKNIANERAIHAIAGSERRLMQQQNKLEKNHRT